MVFDTEKSPDQTLITLKTKVKVPMSYMYGRNPPGPIKFPSIPEAGFQNRFRYPEWFPMPFPKVSHGPSDMEWILSFSTWFFPVRTIRSVHGLYAIKTNRLRSKTVRFESVPSRIITVLEENTAFLRCRKTVPVITRQNGSFSAVKLPFCHDLHSENAL